MSDDNAPDSIPAKGKIPTKAEELAQAEEDERWRRGRTLATTTNVGEDDADDDDTSPRWLASSSITNDTSPRTPSVDGYDELSDYYAQKQRNSAYSDCATAVRMCLASNMLRHQTPMLSFQGIDAVSSQTFQGRLVLQSRYVFVATAHSDLSEMFSLLHCRYAGKCGVGVSE